MSLCYGKIVEWVICGEGEENKWELGGKNVEFYPDISHIFSVTQRVWSTQNPKTKIMFPDTCGSLGNFAVLEQNCGTGKMWEISG